MPFHAALAVDSWDAPAPRERLVWAARRPAVLDLSPRLRAGRYQIVVSAGSQVAPTARS